MTWYAKLSVFIIIHLLWENGRTIPCVLIQQNSKRDVSRIIVVSSSLLKIMEKYYNDYCTGYGQDDWFIQNSKGGAYCKATLYKLYHELLKFFHIFRCKIRKPEFFRQDVFFFFEKV